MFFVSVVQYYKKQRTLLELFFYLSWFLLFSCLVISADYDEVLIDSIIDTFSLLFFVFLSLIPPLLYNIVSANLSSNFVDRRNYYLPAALFVINMFCVLYFGVEKNEENFTYEVVENVMTYVNFITILFVFPLSTIFFSYLSYKKLKLKPIKQVLKLKDINCYLLWFVILYNLYIIIWVFQNYILNESILKSVLKGFYFIYFIASYYCLYKIHKLKKIKSSEDESNKLSNQQKLQEKLIVVLENEKLYLDPKLSVKTLAKQIDSNEKYVSYLINKVYNKNFANFINDYRIEYSKKVLVDNEFKNFTIEAIGNLSGFNSKSGFNTTFKKHTGLTPTQFQKANN